MRCSTHTITKVSLFFGATAISTMALAIATNNWIIAAETTKPYVCTDLNLSYVQISTCLMYRSQPVLCTDLNPSYVQISTCLMYRSQPVLCTDLNLSYVQISKIATTVCIKTLFISTGVRRHNRSNLQGKNGAHWLISVALKISRLNTLMYYNIRTVVSLSIALRIWDIHFTLSLLYEWNIVDTE